MVWIFRVIFGLANVDGIFKPNWPSITFVVSLENKLWTLFYRSAVQSLNIFSSLMEISKRLSHKIHTAATAANWLNELKRIWEETYKELDKRSLKELKQTMQRTKRKPGCLDCKITEIMNFTNLQSIWEDTWRTNKNLGSEQIWPFPVFSKFLRRFLSFFQAPLKYFLISTS